MRFAALILPVVILSACASGDISLSPREWQCTQYERLESMTMDDSGALKVEVETRCNVYERSSRMAR